MDKNEKRKVKNPRQNANPLSVLTFTWIFKTFLTGYRRDIKISDLYSPLKEHASCELGDRISAAWDEEARKCREQKKNGQPNLFRVLVRLFGKAACLYGCIQAILELFIKLSQPLILAKFLQFFANTSSMTKNEAYSWGAGLVIASFLDCIGAHACDQGLLHVGMKMRVACCSLIYRKVLKLSTSAHKDTNVGQMINLLSNDVHKFDYSMFVVSYIFLAPCQTAIITYLLYNEVGLAAFSGIVTLLPFIPIHAFCARLASQLALKHAHRTDERLRLINEFINGIKVIKMYAWEKPLCYFVHRAREKEINTIKKNSITMELCLSFSTCIPRVCLFVTLLTYILLGNSITADTVYLVAGMYNLIRQSIFRMFPIGMRELTEALVSIRRIEKFMLLDEISTDPVAYIENSPQSTLQDRRIMLTDVYVKWSPDSHEATLKNINLAINSGTLVVVVGEVGSGKSTLLQTIIKESPLTQGHVEIQGKISYAAQETWIFASSIRQNILFGQPMNRERYDKVIQVCQLKRDIQLLTHGDQTLVGERGMNLSGGQCARINLARAVYYDADIYLLDDPLSAVDSRVGRCIFEECIKTFLKEKTVILVTHQLQYLNDVDRIIILSDGLIRADGTYDSLYKSDIDLMKISSDIDDSYSKSDSPNASQKSRPSVTLSTNVTSESSQEEVMESSNVSSSSWQMLATYFRAVRSPCLILVVAMCNVLSQVSGSSGDYLVAYWINYEEAFRKRENDSVRYSQEFVQGRTTYIYVLGGITIVTIFIVSLYMTLFFEMCMRASIHLHANMFNAVAYATGSFFDINSVGRIMNRFSKDMGLIDKRMTMSILDVSEIITYAIAVISIMASVNLYLLIPACTLAVTFYFLRSFYISTSRTVKYLEGITRSPVFNHLSGTFQGLSTIRVMAAQKILTTEFDNHQDLHSSAWFIFYSGSTAFGLYLELLCIVFLGFVTFLPLFVSYNLAGDVGLIITQCIALSGMLQQGVKQTAELENQMSSVERIVEYSEIKKESQSEIAPDDKIVSDWPQSGGIEFKNVSLKYPGGNVALKNLNFVIRHQEKIGIVGRTGAGKSSLINALFRLEDIDGEIYIDKVSSKSLGLQELRSKISIIPQEPVLFNGSIRRNLDPFDEHTDDDLWQALEDVEMKKFIGAEHGLNTKVAEGGINFSVGQRQLLCLARAIVKKNNILVLDEATANVDPHTDELIQQTIKRKFENSTVLTIAHRLNTVMDSSRIIVMDQGSVMEFDQPFVLLNRGHGFLHDMVQQSETAMAAARLLIATYTANISNEIRK